MTESDTTDTVEADMELEYNALVYSGSLDVNSKVQIKKSTASHNFQYTTQSYGGDAAIWAKLDASGTNFDEVHQDWTDSIDSDNQFEVGFELHPIWELLNHTDMNQTKARALKAHMTQQWADSNRAIPADYPRAKNGWQLLGLGACHDASDGGKAFVIDEWHGTFDGCKSACENKNDGEWRCTYITYFRVEKWNQPAVCLGYDPDALCDKSPLEPTVNLPDLGIPATVWQDVAITLQFNR